MQYYIISPIFAKTIFKNNDPMEVIPHQDLPKSPGEILASIEWNQIQPKVHSVWFKSYPLTDQQYNILEKMLTGALDPKFELADDEIFTTWDDVSSFTIFMDFNHPYWDIPGGHRMQWFAENPQYFFEPLENEQMPEEKTLIQQWQERATAVGLTLADLCRAGNIDRSTIERWKDKPPKAVAAYQAIEQTLLKAESEKKIADDKAEFDLQRYQQREEQF